MATHHSTRQQPEREQNDATGQQQDGTSKRDFDKGGSEGGETKIAVYGALAANVLIAIAKLSAGFLSGSSAMLAEGAHSIADTMNEVFLLIGLRLEETPADEEHPYGGKDRFLWSFLAAVFIFFAGGLFSIYNGAHPIVHAGQSDFPKRLNTDQIEQLIVRIERAIRQHVPEAMQIFLEAHPSEQPSEAGIERAGAPG